MSLTGHWDTVKGEVLVLGNLEARGWADIDTGRHGNQSVSYLLRVEQTDLFYM